MFGNADGRHIYRRVVGEQLRTGCYLPPIERHRVLGVLMLSRRTDNVFTSDDVTLLEQVARQVTIAVEKRWSTRKRGRITTKKPDKDSISKTKFALRAEQSSEIALP